MGVENDFRNYKVFLKCFKYVRKEIIFTLYINFFKNEAKSIKNGIIKLQSIKIQRSHHEQMYKIQEVFDWKIKLTGYIIFLALIKIICKSLDKY